MTRSRSELLELCDCANCPIAHAGHRSPVMGSGPDDAKLIIIGEAPNKAEKIQGTPFVGQPGHILNATLQRVGLDRSDVYVTNTVLCVPGAYNESPSQAAIYACSKRLRAEIEDRDPKIIMPVGTAGAQALLGVTTKITDLQGVLQFNERYQRFVLPTFHPSYCLRQPSSYEDFQSDFARAADLISGEVTFPDPYPTFDYSHLEVSNPLIALDELRSILRGDMGYNLSLDVETDNTNTSSRFLTIQFGNQDYAAVFDAELFMEHANPHHWEECRTLMEEILTRSLFTFIIHNMSFDLQVVYDNFGIHHSEMANVVDTMCLALGLTERASAIGLKALARKWFNAPYYEEELRPYLKTSTTPYSAIPRKILVKYAAADTIYTARLRPLLDDLTERANTKSLCYDLLMPAQLLFADMQYYGTAIDLSKVKDLRKTWIPRMNQMRKNIEKYAIDNGWPEPWFNPGSSHQLSKFLFDILKLQPPAVTNQKLKEARAKGKKPGRPTGKEFREKYPDHPITRMLEEYSLVKKMVQTYVEGIADDVRPDGRIHPDFLLFGTVTGRLSIRNPPVQTIPRRDTTGSTFDDIRTLFIARSLPDDPETDMVFIGADYKQLELRIGWLLSQDPIMGEAVLSGDFHRITASRIYGIPQEAVTSVQRHNTKYVTFGIMYGREEYSLWKGQLGESGLTLRQSKEFLDNWFGTFEIFTEWFHNQRESALRTGVLQTPFGRSRRWPLITSENKKHVMNEAVNFPVQSTATDVTLDAAIRLQKRFRENKIGRLLFLVHDSIEAEVFASRKDEAVQMFREEMLTLPAQIRSIAPPNFALDIDIEVGQNWGEGHPA